MPSLPVTSEHAQHPCSELLMWTSPGHGLHFPRTLWCADTVFVESPQILEVQMREPVWQVFHGPGIWVPSNVISPVCLHWSFSCYPLCRVPFLPICVCTGQPAVRLPSASLTSLGVEPLQEQLTKSTSEYSVFQQFFLPSALWMKTDIPRVPLQPSSASISACSSSGTAARSSPVKGHQAAGLIRPQICSTALLSQSPDHKQPGALFGENLEKVLPAAPPSPEDAHRVTVAFHASHTCSPRNSFCNHIGDVTWILIYLQQGQEPCALSLDTCGCLV